MVWNLVFAIAWVGIFILSIGGIFLSILPKYILSLSVEEPVFRMILGGDICSVPPTFYREIF